MMPKPVIDLDETRTGGPHRYSDGYREWWSSIHKRLDANTHIFLTPLGLAGDNVTHSQAQPGTNTPVHGGLARAVYAFPWKQHEPALKAALGRSLLGKGVGENLRVSGVTEQTVHVGDLWSWDGALLQVTGPRLPGPTLQVYYDGLAVDQFMTEAGMCGWFLRVITPGLVRTRCQIQVARSETSHPTILQELDRIRVAQAQ